MFCQRFPSCQFLGGGLLGSCITWETGSPPYHNVGTPMGWRMVGKNNGIDVTNPHNSLLIVFLLLLDGKNEHDDDDDDDDDGWKFVVANHFWRMTPEISGANIMLVLGMVSGVILRKLVKFLPSLLNIFSKKGRTNHQLFANSTVYWLDFIWSYGVVF